MSLFLRVILKLLDILTKILGFNGCRYDQVKNKFLISRYWHYYIQIVHWLIVWPFGLLVIFFLLLPFDDEELKTTQISKWVVPLMMSTPLLGMSVEGWIILYYRRELCQLLNHYLKLAQMHREMFGRSVYVPWYYLAIHIVCECYAFSYFFFRTSFGQSFALLMTGRVFVLYYLIDVSMMIHLDFIQSLDNHLNCQSKPKKKILRSLCFKYFEQLLHLHKDLQRVIWIPNTSRLISNIMLYAYIFLTIFWAYMYEGEEFHFIQALVSCMWASNMLHLVKIARSIGGMERDILDRLHLKELMKLLHRLTYSRTLQLEQLEQLHLMQCTLKERSMNIYNYIYVRRTLNLEIVDFFITNAFLLISLSLTYENPKPFLSGFYTISPSN